MRTTSQQPHSRGWRRQAAAGVAIGGLVLTTLVGLANPAQAAAGTLGAAAAQSGRYFGAAIGCRPAGRVQLHLAHEP